MVKYYVDTYTSHNECTYVVMNIDFIICILSWKTFPKYPHIKLTLKCAFKILKLIITHDRNQLVTKLGVAS